MPTDPNDRLLAAIRMMGSENPGGDGEAVNAFRLATRLLKAQGMSWDAVAVLVTERTRTTRQDPPPSPPSTPRGGGFGDIFEGMFADFGRGFNRGARPAETPKPRQRERVHGVDVPREIAGTVRIVDADRTWRDGPMLVLEIVGEHSVYGPLICFAASVQADLRHAHDRGRSVVAKIRPPRSEGQMPVVSSATSL